MSKTWYLYMLECAGGRLYTGIAVDVEARYKAHAEGRGAKFTRSFPPSRIVLVQSFASRSEASKAEHALKRLPPAEKRKLAGTPATA
ncbi:GIY-YIG nuclease family protein [Parvibaculum sp.]|uniref:GIY-YIG nuclease family protein n=1 Tax=Parvibaculum sp. TaxID=2024848 RepID=UPI002BA278E4|nr:GIY-YIG nuclease family protein [Parvibaculum sp.]HUD52843.1 GIY-YIG nuclease family protein [Parvibaculum sp.]